MRNVADELARHIRIAENMYDKAVRNEDGYARRDIEIFLECINEVWETVKLLQDEISFRIVSKETLLKKEGQVDDCEVVINSPHLRMIRVSSFPNYSEYLICVETF